MSLTLPALGSPDNPDVQITSAPALSGKTTPMFAPSGQLGDIPVENANAARASGFQDAISMTSPDGKQGNIPANRAEDAMQAGFTPTDPAWRQQVPQSFIGNVASGAKAGASDIWGQLKDTAQAITPPALRGDFSSGAAAVLPPAYTNAVEGAEQGIHQLPIEYHAYEQARQAGKSPVNAAITASGAKQSVLQITAGLKSATKAFEANPTMETTRGIIDVAALAASIWGGDAFNSAWGTEASDSANISHYIDENNMVRPASDASEAAQPGLINRVIHGGKSVEPGTTAVVGGAATKAASMPAGTAPLTGVSAFGDASETVLKQGSDLYGQIDAATDGKFQANKNALKANQKAFRNAESDSDLTAANIERTRLLTEQDAIFNSAEKQGVSKATVTQARAMWTQGNALQDVDNQVWLSRNKLASATDTAGLPTQVVPRILLPRLQNMFRSGRLQEAFGNEADAASFLKQTKNLARTGATAATIHSTVVKAALGAGGALGGGALIRVGYKLMR